LSLLSFIFPEINTKVRKDSPLINKGAYVAPQEKVPSQSNPDINESMELELSCSNCTTDAEGNLYYEYKGYNYGQIDFYISNVENHTLVGWDSPEQYCVMHWETEICEPVIDGQTYSDENGYGHQNFYMNETLRLIGFINYDVIDEIFITIY